MKLRPRIRLSILDRCFSPVFYLQLKKNTADVCGVYVSVLVVYEGHLEST